MELSNVHVQICGSAWTARRLLKHSMSTTTTNSSAKVWVLLPLSYALTQMTDNVKDWQLAQQLVRSQSYSRRSRRSTRSMASSTSFSALEIFFGPDTEEGELSQLLNDEIEGAFQHLLLVHYAYSHSPVPIPCYVMQGEHPVPQAAIEKFAKSGE